MSTTVVSQSIGVEYSPQGVEVKYYEQIYATCLPRFLSNANPSVIVNDRVFKKNNFYDEGSIEILGNKKNKVVPSHESERRDLGTAKLFMDETPFHDYSYAFGANVIEMQGDPSSGYQLLDLLYPFVLDLEGPNDPGSYDGVIEPFTIRSWITRQSIDRPYSARRVRGAISNFHEDQFGTSIEISQKRFIKVQKIRPYMEYGDGYNRPIEPKHGYFADEPNFVIPMVEKSLENELSKKIDPEISKVLSSVSINSTNLGSDFLSSTSGYTFFDNENGTDSIAFFDQKGI